MLHRIRYILLTFIMLLALAGFFVIAVQDFVSAAVFQVNYSYSLSRFTGVVPYQWARLSADAEHQEVYVLNTREQSIDIYNRHGMEVYSFSTPVGHGTPRDITVGDDGVLYLLAGTFRENSLLKLDFRGELIEQLHLQGLPEEFLGFSPGSIERAGDSFYIADLGRKWIIRTDLAGRFLAGFVIDDLLVNVPDEDKVDVVMNDFTVDPQGRPMFTLPLLWQVGILATDGTLETFGRRGDAPGKFGIISGIAADDNGLIYVSDILRSVVMVFDRDYTFQAEFGGRGAGKHNLIGPSHMTREGDMLYVTQLRERGVSVFRSTVTQ